jgi:hypothetical protein
MAVKNVPSASGLNASKAGSLALKARPAAIGAMPSPGSSVAVMAFSITTAMVRRSAPADRPAP